MDETFRMLGREHQADLEREAERRRLAALAGQAAKPLEASRPRRRYRRLAFLLRPREA